MVKNLWWRASSDCIPTRSQLRLKYVDIDATFPLCINDHESISHCLVECPTATASWNRTGIGVNTSVEGTFISWLAALFQTYDKDRLNIIAMTCWALWRVRNDKVWKGKNARVETVCNLAKNTLYRWAKVQDELEVPTNCCISDKRRSVREMEQAIDKGVKSQC